MHIEQVERTFIHVETGSDRRCRLRGEERGQNRYQLMTAACTLGSIMRQLLALEVDGVNRELMASAKFDIGERTEGMVLNRIGLPS